MHMVIRAIVYAQDEKEGLEKAKTIFEGLCEGAGSHFDYYQSFDEEGTPVSGKGRWGELPGIALVDSPEGKKLIEEGMWATKKEFMTHLKIVRDVLASKSDAEIFGVEFDAEMFRYRCYCLGESEGPSVWLYDNNGEGVRTEERLTDTLRKWDSDEYKDLKVFVVPADVHF